MGPETSNILFPDVPRVTVTVDTSQSLDDGDNHHDIENLEIETIGENAEKNIGSPRSLNPSLFRRPRISAFSPGGLGFVSPRQQQQQQQPPQPRGSAVMHAWAWDDDDEQKEGEDKNEQEDVEEELMYEEEDEEDLFSAVTAGTSHGFTTHRATPTPTSTPAAESEPVVETTEEISSPAPATASDEGAIGTIQRLLDSMTRFRGTGK